MRGTWQRLGAFLLFIFVFVLYVGFLVFNSVHNRRILREIAEKDVMITRSLLVSVLGEMDTLNPDNIYNLFADVVDTGNFDYIALLKEDSLVVWYTAYEGFLPVNPAKLDTSFAYVYINTPNYPIIEFHARVKKNYYLVGGYSLYYIERIWRNSWKNIALTATIVLILMIGAFWFYFVMERRVLAEELKLKEEVARSTHFRELSGLSAQMAHELKNPLNSLNMALQLIKLKGFKDEYIDVITSEARKMNEIVERFGSIARSLQSRTGKIDVEKLLEYAISESFKGIKNYPVKVVKKVGIKDFYSDESLLVHALNNIIKNAIEAMRDAGIGSPELEVEVSGDGKKVCFRVKDNGPGMSEEEKERVFEHFYTSKTYGMGIGLATARRIARTLGGDVKIVSTGKDGTIMELCVKDRRTK